MYYVFLGPGLPYLMSFFSSNVIVFSFNCTCCCMYVHVCAGAQGGQKRVSDPIGCSEVSDIGVGNSAGCHSRTSF